jgi:hypothetical protein
MLEMEPSQPSGLLAQATSFVSKAFGGGKKGKAEPPKSLQLAAQAAKKVRLLSLAIFFVYLRIIL